MTLNERFFNIIDELGFIGELWSILFFTEVVYFTIDDASSLFDEL